MRGNRAFVGIVGTAQKSLPKAIKNRAQKDTLPPRRAAWYHGAVKNKRAVKAPGKDGCMTDNVLFCAAVEKATRADILSARMFALCFDTDDRGERTVRLRYLRDRAVNICTTQKMP